MRPAAFIVTLVGAMGSAGLTLYAGRHNPSRLLVALFVVWVLSPFAALLAGEAFSRRWSAATRTALHVLMLLVPVGSAVVYSFATLGAPHEKAAFPFVVTPPLTWLLMIIVFALAAGVSRRSEQI